MIPEFVNDGDIPPRRDPWQRSRDLAEFAAALRDRPLAWAKYPYQVKRQTASAITSGLIKAFTPAGEYQGTHRDGQIYVRYIGAPE